MRRHARSALSLVLLAPWLLVACGMSDDSHGFPDGGPVDPRCTMRLAFAPAMPSTAVDVVVTATIESNGIIGYRTYDWQVLSRDTELSVTPRDLDGAQIEFRAGAPGPHQVIARGAVGTLSCVAASETINILAPDSAELPYRLRLLPGPGQPLPVQEQEITLYTGTDYALGEVPLSRGIAVTGTVLGSDDEPLAAYLRAVREDTEEPALVEAFADEQGGFAMRLESRRYHVLVVPSDNRHAPARFDGQRAADTWLLVVPPASAVRGTVTYDEGALLAGARVSMRAGALPSTIAVTDDSGAFTLQARMDGALSLTVAPPAASGLPMLELPASAGLLDALAGPAGDLAIAYAPALRTRTVAPGARLADGTTPAAGTRATWIGRSMAGAGTITPAGGAPLAATGSTRLTVVAGPDGAWPPITLPEAVYDVILEPPAASGAPVTLLEVDLTGTAPDILPLAGLATIRGTVTDAAGAGLGQVRVSATPTGLLAQTTAARAATTTAADGSFALGVTGNGTYDLLLDSPAPGHGRRHLAVTAPAPEQSTSLDALALPPARQVTGRVTLLGATSGMDGITVHILCATCSAAERAVPLAETVTDVTGTFTLAVPETAR